MANKIWVTIHGVHTQKLGRDWQEEFSDFVKKKDHDVTVLNFKYGYVLGAFSWLASWIVGTEKLIKWTSAWHPKYCDDFGVFLKNVLENNPGCEISILAHSLGTWITNEVLADLDGGRFQNIVLVSGVISSHMEKLSYRKWIDQEKIRNIFAWCSKQDLVVQAIAQFPFGHLGYYGFLRPGFPEDFEFPTPNPFFDVRNRLSWEDHSGVLDKLDQYGDELFNQLSS